MGDIQIRCARVGSLATNCYIVYDEAVKQALIVDPGGDPDYISQCLEKIGVTPAALMLTHGHSDHFQALADLKEKYHVPVYVHKDDAYRLKFQGGFVDAAYDLQPDDVLVNDGDHLEIGGMKIDVIHTPGHTEGGVCYYLRENNVLLAGDTLFRHSWGRTDFPGGNERLLFKSIREKLLPLPPETVVLPGHEGTTTIEEERRVHYYRG